MTDGHEPIPGEPADPRGEPAAEGGRVSRRTLLLGTAGVVAAGSAAWWVVQRGGEDDVAGPAPTTARPTSTTSTTAPPTTSTTAPRRTFDVRDHGARGDGRADDGPALRATIEAALAESRRLNAGVDPAAADRAPTVLIPSGRYRCPGLADLAIDAPLALRGEGTAVLEAGPAPTTDVLHGITPVLRCTSAVDVEGLELEQGGVWLSFASLVHDTALIRIVGCTFRGARAPASAWPGRAPIAHGADRLVIEANAVEGIGSRDPTTGSYGFGFELQRWGSARVTGNRVTGAFQHGIRLGHQARANRPYADRPDLTCTGNVVDGVWGDEKANGIIVGASGIRISGNTVSHVTSGGDERRGAGDTEGIYVKGEGITVSDNTLLDGGRLQAQITIKGSDARVERNVVESSDGVFSGGIRVEGAAPEIRGNELIGIAEGCDAVSVQAREEADVVVVEGNLIRGGRPKHGIYVGRRTEVVISANRLVGAPTQRAALLVHTSASTPVDSVVVRGNELRDAGGTDGVVVDVRDSGQVGAVVVADNGFAGLDHAVRALAYEGGTIGSVSLDANRYEAVATPVDVSDGIAVTRTGEG